MELNIRGRLREWDRPLVMGIINVTPDSFYADSRVSADEVDRRVTEAVAQGADMIDIGGCSTRPGSEAAGSGEELERVIRAIEATRRAIGEEIPISVDTYRASVAEAAVNAGADIINDISGGDLDPEMFPAVARLGVPYVVMHTRGSAADMQQQTDYANVTAEVLRNLAFKVDRLHSLGVADIIVDPGFGFAKTTAQNFELLGALGALRALGCPILAGLSRKTMIWETLGVTPEKALNGTTALNMIALVNGADILRVHDVSEARETVALFEAYRNNTGLPGRIITVNDRTWGYSSEIFP